MRISPLNMHREYVVMSRILSTQFHCLTTKYLHSNSDGMNKRTKAKVKRRVIFIIYISITGNSRNVVLEPLGMELNIVSLHINTISVYQWRSMLSCKLYDLLAWARLWRCSKGGIIHRYKSVTFQTFEQIYMQQAGFREENKLITSI